MDMWAPYVENMYDLVSYIHQVLPKSVYFKQHNWAYKLMFRKILKETNRVH